MFVVLAGSAVYAAWKDKYFYPGYLAEALTSDADQRWLVAFDDGTKLVVDSGDIIPYELLPLSVDVLALRDNEHKYHESARVLGHYRTTDDTGYVVEFYADKFYCR
jgi:hypothetical protein